MVSLLSITLLSGCADMQKSFSQMKWPNWSKPTTAKMASANCPQVSAMPDLDSITDMRGTDIVTQTSLSSISSTCDTKDLNTTVRLNLGFKSKLGPAGVKDASSEANYSIPYLIAVISPKGEIISKDIFAVSLTYKKGQTEMSYNDILEQIIPLEKAGTASQYKIMIGFQLSEPQLAFNRALSAQKAAK